MLPRRSEFKRNQRGLALILVLTTMTVLITLAANFVLTVSRDTESVDLLNSRIQARYSALSGIQYALFAMQDKDEKFRWTTDGQLYSVTLAGGEVYVRIVPESGRIDINAARPQIMTLLFQYAGLTEEESIQLVGNVIHWRGGDDMQVGDSVTDADYESEGLPIPAHRRFYAIEELSHVYGVTPTIYHKIKSLITVYGGNRINGLVASDAMLALLELTEDDAETIHQARDAYYTDKTPIPNDIRNLSPHLTFSARDAYYRVMAYGKTASGQTEAVYSIIRNQRSRSGSYSEMSRGKVSGEERKAFIESIKNANITTDKG